MQLPRFAKIVYVIIKFFSQRPQSQWWQSGVCIHRLFTLVSIVQGFPSSQLWPARQFPLRHSSPGWHTTPQPPQLLVSFIVSTQVPLQIRWPSGQGLLPSDKVAADTIKKINKHKNICPFNFMQSTFYITVYNYLVN